MEDANNKSVRFNALTGEKFEKVAIKLGRNKRLVFMQMVDYFYRSKKDPIDLNDELLKKELANGINRILSFIKRQEGDFLLPIFSDTEGLMVIAKEHTKYFKAIGQYLINDDEHTKEMIKRMTSLDRAIAKTQNHLEEKALLKLRFKKILEYYISQRESFGWPVSAAKKEELQTHIRQSLENL
ncbi:BfmA/BtgA family mobilization protein [Pedobacter psychroterrae]|uniref:Uncharacterized protein n=1 Tax=Pedobacter psychroterrae TaxID=2530453 RepID=A0A4R0NAZ1_9SPHI|nr:BfmA/BtgA family mobilization protein [Pedobacter psychroterrae]TCC96787.1 hypothetical protein EZ437_20565 [Pedobacter psychroterrae]